MQISGYPGPRRFASLWTSSDRASFGPRMVLRFGRQINEMLAENGERPGAPPGTETCSGSTSRHSEGTLYVGNWAGEAGAANAGEPRLGFFAKTNWVYTFITLFGTR